MISRRLRAARQAARAAGAARFAALLADERDAARLPLLTEVEALVVTHLLEDLIAARGVDPIGDVARTLIIRIYDRLDPRQRIGVTRPHARDHAGSLHRSGPDDRPAPTPGPSAARPPSSCRNGLTGSRALDSLGLDRVHLVVHDIGGPVGFEVAAAVPDRVRSLLLLNTTVAVHTFRRPWMMEPFAHRFVRGPSQPWRCGPHSDATPTYGDHACSLSSSDRKDCVRPSLQRRV